MSWETKPLSSIARISAGQGAPQGTDEFGTTGQPFIRAGSLERLCEGADENELEKIPDLVAQKRRMKLHPAGTIIFAKSGMSATLGRVHKLTRPCYVANHLATINTNASVETNYLAHFFRFSSPSHLIKDPAYPSIRLSDVSAWKVLLPPLIIQKQIAVVLDKADSLYRQRRESIQLTENLLQSAFIDMFGDEFSPKCPRVPLSPYLDFLTSGGRGWAKYYADDGDNFIRSLDVRMNEISEEKMAKVRAPKNAEANRTRTQARDVLLTITGSLIGRAAPVGERYAGSYISQHVAILRMRSLRPAFVAWALTMNEGQNQISRLQRGQAKPGLNFEQIGKIQVPKPSRVLENKFCDLISTRLSVVDEQRNSLAQAEALFSTLQHRAFRGELDLDRIEFSEEHKPEEQSAPKPVEIRGRYKRPGSFIAPPEIEARMMTLEDKLDTGPGDSIPWSEDYFKYRILSQLLQSPFSFREIWEEVEYDMPEASYDDVVSKIFQYVNEGTLEQCFDEKLKEIVFYTRA